MKLIKGFTLIELVIVIVILGILVAIAVPRYVDLSSTASTAACDASKSSAKSTQAIFIANNTGSYPTVTTLADNLTGAMADASGLTISGITSCHINTHSDDACDTATAAVTNEVKCIN